MEGRIDIIQLNTLLTGRKVIEKTKESLHPSRYSVVTHALKTSAAKNRPAYAELKHELLDLDHQDPIEEDSVALTKVNMTSSTTINEVCTDNITSYNPVNNKKSNFKRKDSDEFDGEDKKSKKKKIKVTRNEVESEDDDPHVCVT